MANYHKVEVGGSEENAPFSEDDIQQLQEESDAQDRATEEQMEEEEQREAELVAADRPEWLPEKFEAPEDLVKAYADLQAEYTQSRQNADSEEGEEQGAPDSKFAQSVEDFSQFNQEFAETGDISEENRSRIESWGLPREMIDGYIEGQKAILDSHFNSIYNEVGGEDNYDAMLEWAGDNLPEGEQGAFNESVVNGTPDQMMFAIRSLSSRWQSDVGPIGNRETPLLQGNTGYTGASGAFRSVAELTEAMKDPRYNKDAAYRKDVEIRLSNSNIL